MLSIVGRFIDALYLSVDFEFPDHLKKLLDMQKVAARDSGDDMMHFAGIGGVPGGDFYIRPYGRGKYQYVLENAGFYLALSTWANMPALQIQFKAETLYESQEDEYSLLVDRITRFFAGPKLAVKIKVNRCDVAVDFQEDGYKLPEMEDVITRARARTRHYDGDKANTLTLGKRNQALQAQIYCKSLEVASSDKAWMFEVWEASGVYRETLAVWRAELRFFREGLRAFDVNTMEELDACLGDLAAYAVGGGPGSWLRIVDEDSRALKDKSARPSAGWWEEVRRALVAGFLTCGRKRKGYDPRPSFTKCVELAGAFMARAASIARFEHGRDQMSRDMRTVALNPESWGRLIGENYRGQLARKQTTWAERVNLKTAQLRTVAW